eukprot:1454317-Rhodomonas_salina.1
MMLEETGQSEINETGPPINGVDLATDLNCKCDSPFHPLPQTARAKNLSHALAKRSWSWLSFPSLILSSLLADRFPGEQLHRRPCFQVVAGLLRVRQGAAVPTTRCHVPRCAWSRDPKVQRFFQLALPSLPTAQRTPRWARTKRGVRGVDA